MSTLKNNCNFIFLIILIFLLNTITSCKLNSNENKQSSSRLTAYKLIDTDHADDAILMLEDELENNDQTFIERSESLFTLSSAYASKAGIRIDTLIPLITELKQMFKIQKQLKESQNKIEEKRRQVSASTNQTLGTDSDLIMESFSLLLTEQTLSLKIFSQVPIIQSQSLPYLTHSVRLLEELITYNPLPQYGIYKVILQTILLKSKIVEFQSDPEIEKKMSSCTLDIFKTSELIDIISENTIAIYSALSISNPSSREKNDISIINIIKSSQKIRETIIQNKMDKVLNLKVLNQILRQYKLDKLVACE